MKLNIRVFLCGIVCVLSGELFAQWCGQTVNLKPGWNSVYLSVQPEPRFCSEIFKDSRIKSVWCWNPKTIPVEFSAPPQLSDMQIPSDIEETETRYSNWLVYLPDVPVVSNLFTMIGGRSYMIYVDPSSLAIGKTIPLNLTGIPELPQSPWAYDSWALAGFHLKPGIQMPRSDFFAGRPDLNQSVYRLTDYDGTKPQEWIDQFSDLEGGRAYWVYSAYSGQYSGPISVSLEYNEEFIDFGSKGNLYSAIIANHSDSPLNIALSLIDSSDPPDVQNIEAYPVGFDAIAGCVPINYRDDQGEWQPLPTGLSSLTIELAGGRSKRISFKLDRSQMSASGVYQSILRISCQDSVQIDIPVRAFHENGRAGLWVGTVSVNKVSFAGNEDAPYDMDNNDVVSTSTEFVFPIIIHVDNENHCRLLGQVVELWKKPTLSDDDKAIVTEPGQYVLACDIDALNLDDYEGVSLRDSRLQGRRIASAMFSITDCHHVSAVEAFGEAGTVNQLDYTIHIGKDDALNPFMHRYHPDHDGLNDGVNDQMDEVYEITRHLTFKFTDEIPGQYGNSIIGWGSTVVGGEYREEVDGIHKHSIKSQGAFLLKRNSAIAELEDLK